MAKFALAGLVAVLVVGVALGFAVQRSSIDQAVGDARALTAVTAHGIVEPAVTDGLVDMDAASLAAVDGVVRARVLGGSVVRVKVWTFDGTIVYSDEPRLIGSRFPLGSDEKAALASGRADAELSDLARPENRFEPRGTQLLEVYVRISTPGGRHLLYENYLRFDAVAASGNRIFLSFLPGILGGLLLLEIVQVPLAWSLAHRVAQARRDREQLLQRSLEASDRERRMIARDLHDGAVQNLAGVALQLTAQARDLKDAGHPQAAAVVDSAAAKARTAIGDLRQLLVQIYPPDVARMGLGPAVADLLSPLARDGLSTALSVAPGLRLGPDAETLVYRVAQEAIRNASAHARATSVRVSIDRDEREVSLSVEDDGEGIDPERLDDRQREGHFGLRLLSDLARDAGGSLEVTTAPGSGTRVVLEAPV